WRVRARNEAGWGPFSEIRIVEAATSGIDDARAAGAIARATVLLIPNVANELEVVTATVRTVERGRVRVDIVDPLGRVVETVHDAIAHDDVIVVRFNASTAMRGLNFVRVTTASGSISTPLKVLAR
ncbi:MAG: hypothetical protein H7X80_06000, partial [bacterium]|nr:hypothetical protein [Candidatus Kapabacteria bacterium]